MITRKILTMSAGLVSILIVWINWIGTFALCGGREYGACMDSVANMILVLIPIVPVFIISLAMALLRGNVYVDWFKFLRWYIPLSMFLILITPEYGGFIDPIQKGTVAMATSLIFVICSIVIIGRGYFPGRKA